MTGEGDTSRLTCRSRGGGARRLARRQGPGEGTIERYHPGQPRRLRLLPSTGEEYRYRALSLCHRARCSLSSLLRGLIDCLEGAVTTFTRLQRVPGLVIVFGFQSIINMGGESASDAVLPRA